MKRLIFLSLLSLLMTSCLPTPEEQEERNRIIEKSVRCMWGGNC